MREIAERVLLANSLEEKLRLGPVQASDVAPGRVLVLPDAPGRPDELRLSGGGVRVKFPGTHRLEDERERGVLLHFLANHELLAAELMALVLLRFPNAPKAYRAGVYEAMREEQAHAMMYLRRMRACGIAFGELPVNDHFWRLISPVETLLDFVTRLNLTFEQANLDFSKHYARLFRQVGDSATAAVLEKIHQDEIGHVGHGLKWFRKWKDPRENDWQAFRRQLSFPLSPARAKGVAPFNAESRRLVGLDEEFIQGLEVFGHSRGRTPVVYWFNPNAEHHARGTQQNLPYQANRVGLTLERDLELLMLAWCNKDDALWLREEPATEHLLQLKRAGLELPEIWLSAPPADRRLGGVRPWAWSPDASAKLASCTDQIAESHAWQWREPLPAQWFSKEIGLRLEAALGSTAVTGAVHHDDAAILSAIARWSHHGEVLLKAAFSFAGNGHLRVNRHSDAERTRGWIRNALGAHGAVVVEPWLERVLDFSALYEKLPDGTVELLGLTTLENDAAGRFTGVHVGPKWGSLLPPELALFLYRDCRAVEQFQTQLPAALQSLLPGYVGPLGVDAMVYRDFAGALQLKPIVELNVRCTMGRLAWEWMNQLSPQRGGSMRILRRRPDLDPAAILADSPDSVWLNDPTAASQFLALWTPRNSRGVLHHSVV